MTVIKETKNYKVEVGNSVDSGNPCYKIINKNHGVVEIETYIYPQAIKYVDDLEIGIEGVEDIGEVNNPINRNLN